MPLTVERRSFTCRATRAGTRIAQATPGNAQLPSGAFSAQSRQIREMTTLLPSDY
jgi:hypothetical protein